MRSGRLTGIDVGWGAVVARTIDEYPILAIAGAAAVPRKDLASADVKELRYKESDRIAAMTEGLRVLFRCHG